MSDPLGYVESGSPCPSCGYRISLGALERVRDALRRRKAELPPPRKIPPISSGGGLTVWGSRTFNVGSGVNVGGSGVNASSGNSVQGDSIHGAITSDAKTDAVSIDAEICSRCGTFWKTDAAQEAEAALTEIRALRTELESAVDLLGRVAREEDG